MIALFVRRPVTTAIFILMMVVLGLVSILNLNIEENPKVDFPLVVVRTIYPGATPLEVESQVTKKVEDAVSEVSGIEKLKSDSHEGYSVVIIEFSLNSDVNNKFIEIKDKVDGISTYLPSSSEKPIVEKFDPLAKPVMNLIAYSDHHSPTDLFKFVDKKVKLKLSAIEGVAKVEISGGLERQINVLCDPSLMKKYFVTIDEVVDSIKRKNINVPGGNIEMTGNSIGVRFLGEYIKIDEIANTEILSQEGGRIKLSDLAVIEDSHKRITTKARYNDKEVISLGLINVADANPVKVAQRVYKALPKIQSFLPEGMKIQVVTDNTKIIVSETDDTVKNIVIGIVLTIIILFIFTGNLRVTIISSTVIPASIISTFFLMDMNKFSINTMSLLAIATSLGTLIANAIVIIENVFVKLNEGKDSQTAAIEGTQEVVIPVLASVGTNLVVFTPIAFMGGIVGKFMIQFGLTVVFATIFSLIASLSLTPMLCGLLFKGGFDESRKSKFARMIDQCLAWLLQEYRKIFDLIFKFPFIWFIIVMIGIFSSYGLVKYLGNEFTPKYDMDQVGINMNLSQGTVIEVTEDRVKQVEKIAKQIPEVKNIYSRLGSNGMETANIELELVSSKSRTKSDLDIIQELIPKLALVPGVEFELARGETKGGAGKDIQINIYGHEYEDMAEYSKQMKSIMEKTGYFQSVQSSYKTPKPEIRFIPNQEKLADFGIPNAIIGQNIRSSIYGDESSIYKEEGEEYDINVRLGEAYRGFLTDVADITVKTRKGIIPIGYVGELKLSDSMPSISHRDKERIITISGNLVKSTAGVVQNELTRLFKEKLTLKPGDSYKFAGNAETQDESQKEIAKAFGLATLMTFMILAAILNSWIHPITITFSIVNAFSGVFIALFLGDYSINIASLLALVMLVGLVVNNEIILLEEALHYIQQKGLSIKEGLWQAIQNKFRVILMTSLAIVFGAIPQLFSLMKTKSSMGAVIIGGNLASMVFAFLLTPVVFYYMERLRQFASGTSRKSTRA